MYVYIYICAYMYVYMYIYAFLFLLFISFFNKDSSLFVAKIEVLKKAYCALSMQKFQLYIITDRDGL